EALVLVQKTVASERRFPPAGSRCRFPRTKQLADAHLDPAGRRVGLEALALVAQVFEECGQPAMEVIEDGNINDLTCARPHLLVKSRDEALGLRVGQMGDHAGPPASSSSMAAASSSARISTTAFSSSGRSSSGGAPMTSSADRALIAAGPRRPACELP